jgi:hypothetical protein
MSGSKKLKALTTALIVLLLLNSCTDFFSTSWGDTFKRDPNKVKVTDSNVYGLLNAAKGNTELSRAILDKINADSSDTLKHAAIKAANQAAGVSTLVLENVKTLIDAADNDNDDALGEALTDVTKRIQAAVVQNGVGHISDKLVEILGDKIEDGKPEFKDGFGGSVPESDLTLMAITLILAKAESEESLDEYVKNTWEGQDLNSEDWASFDDDEKLIAATVNEMISRDSDTELTKMLKDLLKVEV